MDDLTVAWGDIMSSVDNAYRKPVGALHLGFAYWNCIRVRVVKVRISNGFSICLLLLTKTTFHLLKQVEMMLWFRLDL